jgi:hypothetical protein
MPQQYKILMPQQYKFKSRKTSILMPQKYKIPQEGQLELTPLALYRYYNSISQLDYTRGIIQYMLININFKFGSPGTAHGSGRGSAPSMSHPPRAPVLFATEGRLSLLLKRG